MTFADRAIETCRRDWFAGKVDESHVRDVLKSRISEAIWAFEFTEACHPTEVRVAACRILAEKDSGGIGRVSQLALMEGDRETLIELLRILGRSGAGLETMESLIASEDTIVRDATVDMFRRTGKVDALFPLIFDKDDVVVKRIKRYINEAGQRGEVCGSRGPT